MADRSISMQNLVNPNGHVNVFGWILFIGTLIALGWTIYNAYVNINKLKKDELAQLKKMSELELNLRALRGDQYQTIK